MVAMSGKTLQHFDHAYPQRSQWTQCDSDLTPGTRLSVKQQDNSIYRNFKTSMQQSQIAVKAGLIPNGRKHCTVSTQQTTIGSMNDTGRVFEEADSFGQIAGQKGRKLNLTV